MTAPSDRILMTSGVIARRLGVSVDTVRRLSRVDSDPLPCFRLGDGNTSPLCIREGALRDWLARREARGVA